MEKDYRSRLNQIKEEADDKCKTERDKYDQFIKEFTDSFGKGNSAENDALKQ